MIETSGRPAPAPQVSQVCEAGLVQRREWMLYKIRPDHYPLNNSIVFELNSFDPLQVQKAIDLVVARHEILRTTLTVMNGKLMQLIHPPEHFSIKYLYFDLTAKAAPEQDSEIHGRMGLHFNAPFNFEFGPMFRVVVFALKPDFYSVHVVFHHLVSDEHSQRIFRSDITKIFRMISDHQPLYLPDIVVQYREYTRFENELLDTPNGNEHREFWKKELANGIPKLEVIEQDRWEIHYKKYLEKVKLVKDKIYRLPCYDERFLSSVVRRYETDDAGQLRYIYRQRIFDKIGSYQQTGRNSLLSLFCSALMLAFHRLSGQKNYAFEIPGSSRVHRKFNETMGWLTTGGPSFLSIPDQYSTARLLDEVDHKLFLLAKYCILPPETVAYAASPPVGSRMPVFLTLSYSENELKPSEEGITYHAYEGHGTFQDLAFFFILYKDAITLQLLYDTFLFTPALVETLVKEHANAVEALLQSV